MLHLGNGVGVQRSDPGIWNMPSEPSLPTPWPGWKRGRTAQATRTGQSQRPGQPSDRRASVSQSGWGWESLSRLGVGGGACLPPLGSADRLLTNEPFGDPGQHTRNCVPRNQLVQCFRRDQPALKSLVHFLSHGDQLPGFIWTFTWSRCPGLTVPADPLPLPGRNCGQPRHSDVGAGAPKDSTRKPEQGPPQARP